MSRNCFLTLSATELFSQTELAIHSPLSFDHWSMSEERYPFMVSLGIPNISSICDSVSPDAPFSTMASANITENGEIAKDLPASL